MKEIYNTINEKFQVIIYAHIDDVLAAYGDNWSLDIPELSGRVTNNNFLVSCSHSDIQNKIVFINDEMKIRGLTYRFGSSPICLSIIKLILPSLFFRHPPLRTIEHTERCAPLRESRGQKKNKHKNSISFCEAARTQCARRGEKSLSPFIVFLGSTNKSECHFF